MNARSKKRHEHYIGQILENMNDGEERSSRQCNEFLGVPQTKDVASIMGRAKMEFLEKRMRYRIKKRMQGRTAFWRLEEVK